MRLANLLLDLDGTLTDPKVGITSGIRFALAQLAVEVPHADDLHDWIGPPLKAQFGKFLGSADEVLLDSAVAHYRSYFSVTGLYENTLYEGVPEALAGLKEAGYRIFLATAKPRVFAERILAHFELSSYFDRIHGSELDGRLTDKRDLVRHILETEALDPAETIIAGDRDHDVIGGKANGIFTASITYGYGSLGELQAAGPERIFGTLPQLVDFLIASRAQSARQTL